MSGRVVRALKQFLTARPYLEKPGSCTACGTCGENCPVDAIHLSDRRPVFDYGACIRCYCCHEVCPESAIGRQSHWTVRPFIGL